ncbi:MAG: DUF924 domain-containing protein [Alphaproteobacteria bacterium]|nr:DUF924 domain-containing protein [Alphaproteobacteria bacterium]
MIEAKSILDFWFIECSPKMWFKKNDKFDALIRNRFLNLIKKSLKTNIEDVNIALDTYLSLIILLDQFTRNVFRNSSKSFEGDNKAVKLTKIAIDNNFIKGSNHHYNSFFLMPLMHSENILDHRLGLPLFKKFTNENTFKFALKHKDIIDKFDKFPHRNNVLGRISTKSELEFLKLPGSRF